MSTAETYTRVETDQFVFFVSDYAYSNFSDHLYRGLSSGAAMNADLIIDRRTGQVVKNRWGLSAVPNVRI